MTRSAPKNAPRQLGLYITQELFERLAEAAWARRQSRSELVREALETYLDGLSFPRRPVK